MTTAPPHHKTFPFKTQVWEQSVNMMLCMTDLLSDTLNLFDIARLE